jgi:His-Xaa-Ser system protein HxsD
MTCEVRFDLRVFAQDAIKKALYRFSDRITYSLSIEGHELACVISLRTDAPAESVLDVVIEKLRVEVLDQDLRERLFEQTAPYRNAVLALAFSRTGLQG